jgi:hypothetical protein
MVTTMLRILFGSILALTFVACESTTPSGTAQLLTMEELTTTPGYAWFPAEMNSYSPSQEMVDAVNARYKAGEHKIYVFVKPSCSCKGTKKLFPQIVKTLEASNIDMSEVEIWSMRYESDSHPYEGKMSIHDLPTIFVMHKNVVIHEVGTSSYNEVNADTLIAEALLLP